MGPLFINKIGDVPLATIPYVSRITKTNLTDINKVKSEFERVKNELDSGVVELDDSTLVSMKDYKTFIYNVANGVSPYESEIVNNPNSPNDANGNGIPDYLEVNNHSVSEDELEIFNLVTPNGDGDNDVFVIRNIELYPNNSVEIYNRWGILVYDERGYDNNLKSFKGISEGRNTVNKNELLPDGTYFYILKFTDEENKNHDRSGYLYLNR